MSEPILVPAALAKHWENEARHAWSENARLKAEVERLTLENSQYEEHHKYGQNVITSLREEVERLTKAGDSIIQILCLYVPPTGAKYALMDWNAAKEVQS